MFRKNKLAAGEKSPGGEETHLLRSIQWFSLVLLAVLIGGCWYFVSAHLALSVFWGGVLANGSFILLRRDITRFMDDFVRAGENWKTVKRMVKARLFLNFYARLAVLGVILYLLSTQVQVNMIGLAVGLSTIMISVIAVVLSKGSMLYSTQRFKGA